MHLCRCITMHNSPVLVHSLPKNGLVVNFNETKVCIMSRGMRLDFSSLKIFLTALFIEWWLKTLQVVTCPSVLEKFNVVIQKIMKMPPSRKTLSKGSCPSGVYMMKTCKTAWILRMLICQARNWSETLTWRFEPFHDESRPHLIISINHFHTTA